MQVQVNLMQVNQQKSIRYISHVSRKGGQDCDECHDEQPGRLKVSLKYSKHFLSSTAHIFNKQIQSHSTTR